MRNHPTNMKPPNTKTKRIVSGKGSSGGSADALPKSDVAMNVA